MAIEPNNIFQNLLKPEMTAPPLKGLFEHRAIASVFSGPVMPYANPDDVAQKNHTLPTIPGAPPTTGLQQVVYDAEPLYNRYATVNPGPVRSFFRAMMRQQKMVRQP